MGKTYIQNNKSWVERPKLMLGLDKYDFFVVAAQGIDINGKTFAAILATDYTTRLETDDVYIVLRDASQSLANKGVVPAVTVVVVGMDQWVVTDTLKGAAVCTSGIIGCVGVVLHGGSQIGVTHVLDGFEKQDGQEEPWKSYKVNLAKMVAAMARIDSVTIISSSEIHVKKCLLLAGFLAEQGVELGRQEQKIATGFLLEPSASSWKMTLSPTPLKLLAKPAPVVVSKANLHIIKSGTLSASAADSGG